MTHPRIVVVGSSNTDMIVRVKHLPRPGETVVGGEFSTAAGGKGANQAVAAARAGGKVHFVARVGQDTLGDNTLTTLRNAGIDVTHVTQDRRAPSGAALISVSETGENAISVASGANSRLSRADVTAASSTIKRANVLLLQLETPLETVSAAAKGAASKGVKVILNPAPACALPNSLLRHVSILTPNEIEAEYLTGLRVTSLRSARKAAEKLRRRGDMTVVLTLGARGALIADEQGTRLVSGFPVKAIDTTAAGDIFNGALAVALGNGRSVDEAVRFANAAAALSVTKLGAQPSAPMKKDIERFLAQSGR